MAKKYELNENEQAQVSGGTVAPVTLQNNTLMYGCNTDDFSANSAQVAAKVCLCCMHCVNGTCNAGHQNNVFMANTKPSY